MAVLDGLFHSDADEGGTNHEEVLHASDCVERRAFGQFGHDFADFFAVASLKETFDVVSHAALTMIAARRLPHNDAETAPT